MKRKQIVIDKDAFVGIRLDDLCDFAKDHFLILPEVLIYECMTSDDMTERQLLQRCRKVIVSGAYYCPRSVTYLKWEARNTSPYPWFLPDLQKTHLIRKKNSVREEHTFDRNELGEVYNLHCTVAKGILSDTSEHIKATITSEKRDIARKIKKMPQDRSNRLVTWFEIADTLDMHDTVLTKIPSGFISNGSRFCTSREWISWQYFRLLVVLVDEYYYLGETGGSPQNESIEHDFQDMEYVLLLSRADALLTRDERLVKPLAKAGFPEKDVFSGLDEVTEDYVCHWGQ